MGTKERTCGSEVATEWNPAVLRDPVGQENETPETGILANFATGCGRVIAVGSA